MSYGDDIRASDFIERRYDGYGYDGRSGEELPRSVPQDPESVKREQEVRESTAEALRAIQVGRGPTREEIEALLPPHTQRPLIDVEADAHIYGTAMPTDRRLAFLEDQVAALNAQVEALKDALFGKNRPR